jgi:hypothetical protein
MSLLGVSHGWEREVQRLVPGLGVWARRSLALLSLGIALAAHCSLSQAATRVSGRAAVPSTERRFRRLVANGRLEVAALRPALSGTLLGYARGTTLWLALDDTTQGTAVRDGRVAGAALKMLAVRLLYRHRAIPLAWVVYRPGQCPAPYVELIGRLFDEVAAGVPAASRVVLLTDRGLAWPDVIRLCQARGWSFLVRVQAQTRARLADGTTLPLAALIPLPGQSWLGAGAVFKKAGWLTAGIVAVWRRAGAERWLLVTDLPPTLRRTAEYRRRMWEEESFRDDKSCGFQWEASRLRDPARMDRLLLALQLAMCFVLAHGTRVLKRGLRPYFERRDRHDLSIFSLGLRYLAHALTHARPLYPRLVFYFP